MVHHCFFDRVNQFALVNQAQGNVGIVVDPLVKLIKPIGCQQFLAAKDHVGAHHTAVPLIRFARRHNGL